MGNNKPDAVLRAHLEALDPECRWCFAVDMKRVKGVEIARHDSPDAMLLHFFCPRCLGEWSEYIRGFEGEYLRNRIYKLHPELEGKNFDQEFEEAKHRLWPEHPDGPPRLYSCILVPEDDWEAS